MSSPCPDQETLERFLLGDLDRGTSEQIEEHFVQCERCARVAATVANTDHLTDALQSRRAISPEDESQLSDLAAKLSKLSTDVEKTKCWNDQSSVVHGLLQTDLGSCPVSVNVYFRREIVFVTPLDGTIEIGRQSKREPPPYCRFTTESHDRLVVAPLQQTKISRRHLQLESHQDGKVKATSLTSKGDIVVDSQMRLGPGKSRIVELSTLLQLGDIVIRLEKT